MRNKTSQRSIDETLRTRPPIAHTERAEAQAKVEKIIAHLNGHSKPVQDSAPWILQQFLDGEIDLDRELTRRFRTMPLMASFRARRLGGDDALHVATLTTQDDSANLIIDAEAQTRAVQFTFVYGSMLSLRFRLDRLTDNDRGQWLEWMQRESGGLAFLWSQARWDHNYVICNVRQYYTNFYAFSPRGFEAAARLTAPVTKKMLDWLAGAWKPEAKPATASW